MTVHVHLHGEAAPQPTARTGARSVTRVVLGSLEVASESLSTGGWSAAQDRLAALSSDSVHRDVRSSHAGMVEDPNGSDASVAAITTVARSVSTGSPVSAS